MSGTTSTTSVNLSDVTVSLEAENSTQHALVLSSAQGTLRIVGTVPELRGVAQGALVMSIPPLPQAPTSHAAPTSDLEARLARVEEALTGLNEIAQAARRRGLV